MSGEARHPSGPGGPPEPEDPERGSLAKALHREDSSEDGAGLIPAVEWMLDIIEMYEERLKGFGDPPELVHSDVNEAAKAKARRDLEIARAALTGQEGEREPDLPGLDREGSSEAGERLKEIDFEAWSLIRKLSAYAADSPGISDLPSVAFRWEDALAKRILGLVDPDPAPEEEPEHQAEVFVRPAEMSAQGKDYQGRCSCGWTSGRFVTKSVVEQKVKEHLHNADCPAPEDPDRGSLDEGRLDKIREHIEYGSRSEWSHQQYIEHLGYLLRHLDRLRSRPSSGDGPGPGVLHRHRQRAVMETSAKGTGAVERAGGVARVPCHGSCDIVLPASDMYAVRTPLGFTFRYCEGCFNRLWDGREVES